jgi:hypothetical protein
MACAMPSAADAADPRKEAPFTIPRRSTESTLLNLGVVAISIHTENIMLGAAALPVRPSSLSFAASPSAYTSSVTGSARAALTLSLSLGDLLADRSASIPLPLGAFAHAAKASLSMEAGGKLSVAIGTSFGIGSSRGPAGTGGTLKLNTNLLKPWKHTTLNWRIQF